MWLIFLKADGIWGSVEIEDEEEGSRSTIRRPTLATGPPVVQSSDSREKVIQGETIEKGEETALLGDGDGAPAAAGPRKGSTITAGLPGRATVLLSLQ